jgi:hypothetical protein
MEALERAARRLSVEGAGRRLMRAEIVEQRAGHCGLADTTFVGANENHGWSGHELLPFMGKTTGRETHPDSES